MKRLTSKNPLTESEAMNLSLTDLYMRLKAYEDAEEQGRLVWKDVLSRNKTLSKHGTDARKQKTHWRG